MGVVIRLDDYRYPWKEVFSFDADSSTLQVYVNERSGAAEVVQSNDAGEVIRTPMSAIDATIFIAAFSGNDARRNA